jgi:hypothetical protein
MRSQSRHRSKNFGSPDEWLKKVGADVILAFFGFNESFKGPEGVATFKTNLDRWVKETQAKNYSRQGRTTTGARVAGRRRTAQGSELPGPCPAQRQPEAVHRGDGRGRQGERRAVRRPLQPLPQALRRRRQGAVPHDQRLPPQRGGDKAIAPILFQSLFGKTAPGGNRERLRAAINEKNAQWHARYRTVDGYNVYGGRSALAYQAEKGAFIADRNAPAPYISNYKVMQEEMSVRDTLTANRDKRVWGVAQGENPEIDDSDLPKVTPVPSNKPGSIPTDPTPSHRRGRDREDVPHAGMKINLFASEEQFPELANPVQMAWDTKNRLWIAAWPNYPERRPRARSVTASWSSRTPMATARPTSRPPSSGI